MCVVERELEIVVLQPSVVAAVPRRVEISVGIVVEQHGEVVIRSLTFLGVGHRASELVGALHETIHFADRTGSGRFYLLSGLVHGHVAIALVQTALSLIDQTLQLGIATGLLHELAQLCDFRFADGAHVPRRTVGRPVPRYHVGQGALGVNTGVFGRRFGQVRRIEAEVAGDFRVGLNRVGVHGIFSHRNRLIECRSRTDVVAGFEVAEIELSFLLGGHHFPHHLAGIVREGVAFVVVHTVVLLECPAECTVAGIHGRAVVECTAVIVTAVFGTPARHDVVTGHERIGRRNEILISRQERFGHRLDFGIRTRGRTVDISLGLVPKFHELVVLFFRILGHTATHLVVLDFFFQRLATRSLLHHALEGIDGFLLQRRIGEPHVAAVVRAERHVRTGVVAGIVEQRDERAGGIVGLVGLHRSDGQAVAQVQIGGSGQIEVGEIIVVLRLVDVGIHPFVFRGGASVGVGTTVSAFGLIVHRRVHRHFPSAFHRGGVELGIAGLREVIAVLALDVVHFRTVLARFAGHFLEVVDKIGREARSALEAIAPKEPCGAGGFRAAGLQEIGLTGLHIVGRGGTGRGVIRPVAAIGPHRARTEQERCTDNHQRVVNVSHAYGN